MRFQRTAGTTTTPAVYLGNSVETSNAILYAGKVITFSFYIKTGANYSGSGVNWYFNYGTGTDENILTTYTGNTTLLSGTFAANTTWTRVTGTATLPSNATEFATYFNSTTSGTALADDSFYITGVQLDLGSYNSTTAPAFRRSGGTLQGELAACQRYYYRSSATPSGGANFLAPMGAFSGSTNFSIPFMAPVPMRATPSSTIDFSTLWVTDFSSNFAVTAMTLDSNSTNNCIYLNGTIASGGTIYRPAMLRANASSSAYIGFTAEL